MIVTLLCIINVEREGAGCSQCQVGEDDNLIQKLIIEVV